MSKNPLKASLCGCCYSETFLMHQNGRTGPDGAVFEYTILVQTAHITGTLSQVKCVSEWQWVHLSFTAWVPVCLWLHYFYQTVCPPAVSQAAAIYSSSCEVISSSHFAAHAVRDRREIVESRYFGDLLYIHLRKLHPRASMFCVRLEKK